MPFVNAGHIVVHVPFFLLDGFYYSRHVSRHADHKTGIANTLEKIMNLIKLARFE